MKRLIRAGNAYLWAIVIREYLGLALMALAGGAAIGVIVYAWLMLTRW